MAIRLKKVYNAASKRYYMKAYNPNVVSTEMLAQLVSNASAFSKGTVIGIMTDVMLRVVRELQNSNQVSITGLGTFRAKAVGTSDKDCDKVSARNVREFTIQYIPDDSVISLLNLGNAVEVVDKSGNSIDTDTSDESNGSEDDDHGGGDTNEDDTL